MVNRKRNWENSHRSILVDLETFENLEEMKSKVESMNSYIGFLIEFYKAHEHDFGVTKP